jgi:hypothetical protein
MAFRDDGGNFSNDLFARMLALKQGSASNDELSAQEKIPQQAIDAASGVLGTIGNVGQGIKLIPSAGDEIAEQFAQKYKGAPSFFEKFGRKAVDGTIQSSDEAATQAYQQQLRDQAFKERNAQQLLQQKDSQFQNLRKMFGK